MANEFVLRRAIDADCIALSQLAQQTFRETYIEDLAVPYSEHVVETYFRSSKTPEWYANKIADPLRAVWIIEDKLNKNDELVAFLIACQCNLPHVDVCLGKDGEIEYLYVRRDRQSYGLGKRLINEAISWIQERYGERPIWLATMSCNLKAQKYYTKNYSFIQVGEYSKNIGEYEQKEIIMKREHNYIVEIQD